MSLYLNLDGSASGVRRLEYSEDASSFGFPAEDFEFTGPLNVTLRVVRDGSTVMVNGQIEAQVRLACGRCLSPFVEKVEAELKEIFHLIDGPPPFRPDDDEGIRFVNRRAPRIDLMPAVREQVLLELPMKTVCRPDCRGLCPTCGANLNDGTCGCTPRESDPRWGALRGLDGLPSADRGISRTGEESS